MSTANKKSSKAAKTSAKKRATKKTATKSKVKSKVKRAATKRTPSKKSMPGMTTSARPVPSDCKCKQKKPNGKFFCFRLEQGRWVQSSFVPFATKESCEEVMCED